MKQNILSTKKKNLTATEVGIVKKINQDPQKFVMLNIIELSKLYFSSKSSLSRLARKLNFENIFEMKIYLQSQITKFENHYILQEGENIQKRLSNLLSYNNYGINETLANIDTNNLLEIIHLIKKANNILSFGIGSSYLAASEIAINLQKIGLKIAAFQEIHNAISKVSCFNKEDVVLIFSKSASNRETIFLLDATKKMKAKTILITANESIEKNVDFKILLKDLVKTKRLIATNSKVSQLIIADALFYELYFLKQEELDGYLSKSLELLDNWNCKSCK